MEKYKLNIAKIVNKLFYLDVVASTSITLRLSSHLSTAYQNSKRNRLLYAPDRFIVISDYCDWNIIITFVSHLFLEFPVAARTMIYFH